MIDGMTVDRRFDVSPVAPSIMLEPVVADFKLAACMSFPDFSGDVRSTSHFHDMIGEVRRPSSGYAAPPRR
jgi:hypothetical protein